MRLHSLVAFAVLTFVSATALADSATETRLRDALRNATAQVQALEDERAKWHETESAMRKELEVLRKQPPRVVKVSKGDVEELRREVANEAAVAAKLKESLAQCQTSAQKSVSNENEVRTEEVARLTAEIAAFKKRLAASEARNAKLFQVGMDVVTWASNLKVSDLGDAFVGVKRVELENTAQDFEDKLLDQKARP